MVDTKDCMDACSPLNESTKARAKPAPSCLQYYQRKPALNLNRRGYVNILPIVLIVDVGA